MPSEQIHTDPPARAEGELVPAERRLGHERGQPPEGLGRLLRGPPGQEHPHAQLRDTGRAPGAGPTAGQQGEAEQRHQSGGERFGETDPGWPFCSFTFVFPRRRHEAAGGGQTEQLAGAEEEQLRGQEVAEEFRH